MKLNTPRWWYMRDKTHGSVLRFLLRPLSLIWQVATARRLARGPGYDPGVPVISVGNLTVGGSGKTPLAREILRLLRSEGLNTQGLNTQSLNAQTLNAQGLTRGYGGRLEGPVQVDLSRHTALDVGDEPLLLAQQAPIWVARDRAAGARAAVAAGAQALVLDDGHQNPALHKTVSLIIVDGETRDGEWPFGDGSVFPSGPMREPLKAGLARADGVIILLPTDQQAPDPELVEVFAPLPVFIARLEAKAPPPPGPQLGFAGIAKPWKVERSLRAAGCDLVDFAAFGDHATLGEDVLQSLAARAETLGAGLVTTEKDWLRLPPAWRDRVSAWPVEASLSDPGAFDAFLKARMGVASA